MTKWDGLVGGMVPVALALASPASAQDLQTRPAPPPAVDAIAAPADPDQIGFSAASLEYDQDADLVTANGEVRMVRNGSRLRADKIVWDRRTGKVVATGNVATVNQTGDTAYGDRIELTDTLKDGTVANMLVVLGRGGRIAADRGTRDADGTTVLDNAAYTACSVTNSEGCPKNPSWKITAVRVTYRPAKHRIYYDGARVHLFGLPSIPLPSLSNPVGGEASNGLLNPDIRYTRTNGLSVAVPYFFRLAPNRSLTVTPFVFSAALPLLKFDYAQLTSRGAYRITGYGTVSRRSDDLITGVTGTSEAFRGYLDAVGRFQLSPEWSLSGSIRAATDKTFQRRYDISYDDRLRSTLKAERIDDASYLSITGWAVQTLRLNDGQAMQPFAFPEVDYRRRFTDPLLGGKLELQLNTLALTRSEGQDTRRAFAGLRWDLRKLTPLGQEVTFTAYARGDAYDAHDTLSDPIASYRGVEGFQGRAIGALAVDVQWPLVGAFGSGIQRVTPRLQIVASPTIKNLSIPNEDSRAVDLDDTNLFALNRFPGYDRYEDSSRATYGVDWAIDLPGLRIENQIGQSYRFSSRSQIFFPGTGLSDNFSDVVGRSDVRWRDFVALTLRYRIDHSNLVVRRNEVDATVGTRSSYVLLGYTRLNRDIMPLFEDLQDREEARVAGRVQISRFWSAFGSIVIDLTDRREDPLSLANGFQPIRHRLGVQYEDDCLRLGVTWRRNYADTGDARGGNGYLLTLSFKNLGR